MSRASPALFGFAVLLAFAGGVTGAPVPVASRRAQSSSPPPPASASSSPPSHRDPASATGPVLVVPPLFHAYRANIERVIRRHLSEVRHCHQQGLAQVPEGDGMVVVRIVIGREGVVIGSSVLFNTVPLPSTADCIVSAVRRWSFPPVAEGFIDVRRRFVLRHECYITGRPSLTREVRTPAMARRDRECADLR